MPTLEDMRAQAARGTWIYAAIPSHDWASPTRSACLGSATVTQLTEDAPAFWPSLCIQRDSDGDVTALISEPTQPFDCPSPNVCKTTYRIDDGAARQLGVETIGGKDNRLQILSPDEFAQSLAGAKHVDVGAQLPRGRHVDLRFNVAGLDLQKLGFPPVESASSAADSEAAPQNE